MTYYNILSFRNIFDHVILITTDDSYKQNKTLHHWDSFLTLYFFILFHK